MSNFFPASPAKALTHTRSILLPLDSLLFPPIFLCLLSPSLLRWGLSARLPLLSVGSRRRVFQKLLYHHRQKSPVPSATASKAGGSTASSRESSYEDRRDSESKEKSSGKSESRFSRRKSRRLKDAAKDSKLKLFLKRSSEPFLEGTPFGQGSSSSGGAASAHQTMIIEEFEPDVFRQLIEYIHTGCVTLQARTLLGLMNAADYYGLEELRKGCINFVTCCINVDTVCALLASAERYIQYKCTKSLVQRVLEFVDHHGNDVLSLGSFALLPEHVVRLILSREELKADELTKFQAALHWSQRYCDHAPASCDLRDVISNFYECIEFYKIPATVLMRDVHPLGVVPDHVMMNALAFQVRDAILLSRLCMILLSACDVRRRPLLDDREHS